MAYTPTQWKDGDLITAKRLNKLEEGVANEQIGPPGAPGKNGVSPAVAVTDIPGGHRVTITDAEGSKSFDVLDGKDSTGDGGTAGVTSFNGRDGAVTPKAGDYTAAMVGALSSTTSIPSKTSELENDSGFTTMEAVTSAIQAAILDSWEGTY